MAGMTGRMSTVIKAKISKLLDKAEDPAETLDYSYQKQLEALQNVKKGIADVVTSKKRLQMQSQKLEQSVVKLDTQARQALSAGNEELARTALERKQRRADRAAVARSAGRRARGPAGEADRVREEAALEDRGLPHEEGSHQGAVLRRRGAGPDLRGRDRRRRGDGRRRARDAARRRQDREHEGAAPTRSSELEAAGTFEDLTQLGEGGSDDIDRQLAELTSGEHGRRRAREDAGGARHRLGGRRRARRRTAERRRRPPPARGGEQA